MPNYTDPLIWRIVNGNQFRCIANVDAVPPTHSHYDKVVQASQHYNQAMNFYMQGLIHHSRFTGLSEENPALLRNVYTKMWEHIHNGLTALEPLSENYKLMSMAESEKQIMEWTKYNFEQMVAENPRLFTLRTAKWYESEREWEKFRKEEEARAERRKHIPKITLLIPRADVVERFRQSGREYEEGRRMRQEDIVV